MSTGIRRQAVHEQVVAILRREIRTRHRPGDRLPSLRELVARFHVSLVSVTQAMVALTAEGLVERRHGSGNYVADRRTAGHVALLTELDILHPSTSRFFPYVFSELRNRLAAAGLDSRLYLGRRQADAVPSFTAVPELQRAVTAGTVRAVVALHSLDETATWARELATAGVPVLGDQAGHTYAVMPDMAGMITAAVDSALAQGRTRLGLLSWSPRPEAAPPGPRPPDGPVVEAFRNALAASGARFNPQWCRGDIHPSARGAGWSEFRELWAASREKPDALIIADDMLLADAAQAWSELHVRVPEQLLVVSHVNRGCSTVPAGLSLITLEYDPQAHARALFDMLVPLLAGEAPPTPYLYVPHRLRLPPGCGPVAPTNPDVRPKQARVT